MKRRAEVETSIVHLKQEHRMDRDRSKGVGDQINAILNAADMIGHAAQASKNQMVVGIYHHMLQIFVYCS